MQLAQTDGRCATICCVVLCYAVALGSKVSKLKDALQEALAAHGFDSRQEGLLLGHITRNVR
jgi:hypothetical protein